MYVRMHYASPYLYSGNNNDLHIFRKEQKDIYLRHTGKLVNLSLCYCYKQNVRTYIYTK